MAELISVRKRFERYRSSPQSGLTLTGSELSMLLEDRSDVPIFVDVQGDRVIAEVALPSTDSRCWPVKFEGALSVHDGRAIAVPDRLVVGLVDLTPFARGATIELEHDQMPSARASAFLRQTRAAAAASGQLVVELRDPATFSWRSQPTASAAE